MNDGLQLSVKADLSDKQSQHSLDLINALNFLYQEMRLRQAREADIMKRVEQITSNILGKINVNKLWVLAIIGSIASIGCVVLLFVGIIMLLSKGETTTASCKEQNNTSNSVHRMYEKAVDRSNIAQKGDVYGINKLHNTQSTDHGGIVESFGGWHGLKQYDDGYSELSSIE